MLHKHLQRLEQALEGAKFETDLDSMRDAEVIEHNDDGMCIFISYGKILDSF